MTCWAEVKGPMKDRRLYLSIGRQAGAAAAGLAQGFGGEAESLGAGGGEAPPLGAAGQQQLADGRHLGRTASFGGRLRSAAQPWAGAEDANGGGGGGDGSGPGEAAAGAGHGAVPPQRPRPSPTPQAAVPLQREAVVVVSTTAGRVDPAQGVGSVGQLLQLGAEQPAAVDAGAPLPARRQRAASGPPHLVGERAQGREAEAGQVQGAGRPVALVQAGLPDGGERRDGPPLVQEEALLAGRSAAVQGGAGAAGGGGCDAQTAVLGPTVQAVVTVEAMPAAGETGGPVDVGTVDPTEVFSLGSDGHHLTAVHHPLEGLRGGDQLAATTAGTAEIPT